MVLSHVTASRPAPVRLNPAKLYQSKWTAVAPRNKEKHFMVTRVVQPELPGQPIEFVELEAVYSRRSVVLPWRALTDASQWRQGWRRADAELGRAIASAHDCPDGESLP